VRFIADSSPSASINRERPRVLPPGAQRRRDRRRDR
jgi:hypothetical protein